MSHSKRLLHSAISRVVILTCLLWLSSLELGCQPSYSAEPEASIGSHSHSITTARVFEEPLLRTKATSADEDNSLKNAIDAYLNQSDRTNLRVFERAVAAHPESGWNVALLTNLGLAYYHYGYFSKAIAAWDEAWHQGQDITEPRAKALVDRAVGELARMHARLGHAERLTDLFEELGDRPLSGPATESVLGAREGLWIMENKPEIAYLCGPMALKSVLIETGASAERAQFLDNYKASPRGVALAEVYRLSRIARLPYQLAYREQPQSIPIPAIVHWKVNHFAAVIGERDGRYHIKDPTFGEDQWVTQDALDSESSGYFLIPGRWLPAGWRDVSAAEANRVRGMGYTGTNNQDATTPDDDDADPNKEKNCKGMCVPNIKEMTVSLTLSDTPIGYRPAIGPSLYVTLTYNQKEANQPANFSYFNLGPKWTLNWLSYIQDDPSMPGANVMRYVAGGGATRYINYSDATGTFRPEPKTGAVLVRTVTSSGPTVYSRLLANGGKEIYAQNDGSTGYPSVLKPDSRPRRKCGNPAVRRTTATHRHR
jgi:tetratricopeptide (TPR) repeat protein